MEHKECNSDIYYAGTPVNKWFLLVEGSSWDTYTDGFEIVNVEINYCPSCGAKLLTNGETNDVI
ncbi:hypothetical protein BSK59_13580 [Paenibacillus odorifer]|uniref:hypothetical protein n=1 Tax=Paenibacillus odorifer TaxID=189426 RepID=UPI00096F898D|nr:hypothetical protein [Paenibacillus odorifer]OME55502.1 hypothetical protein BSK59_13580 [Paenibacillus odorifer]